MKNQIKKYFEEVNNYINNNSNENIHDIIETHLIKISFYQHERLIHLLVTLAFAILEMLSIIYLYLHTSLLSIIFTILFFILLIPYIFHYYFLENSVQEMYKQYEKLKEKYLQ